MQTKEDFFMEVKKAKWLKFISAIAIFAVMIFCTGLNVHAEDVKDGILVTVSSDKENYNSEDEVNLKITVKNTNDFEVSDIKVENILPDGISLVSGDISKDSIHLQANEEATMDLTVKKADSGQADITDNTTSNVNAVGKSDNTTSPNSSPKTGENDTPLIALIVMIISIVIMIVCFWKGRKKHLKFLSLFVCLGVVGTFGITGITHAVSDNTQTEAINSSDENISSFTTEFTYVIDNVNYTNNTTITYYTIDFYVFCDTDKKIEEIIDTDTFENANLEERKVIVLNCLNKLESENRIKKGSIKFNEEYNSYFFEYINGGEGSVLLESFSLEEKGDIFTPLSISDKIDTSYIPSYTMIVWPYINQIEYCINNSSNGYIKSILSDNNLNKNEKTALRIDEVPTLRNYRNYQKEIWSSNGLKTTTKQDVTVEDFKTLLKGYDFIELIGHGYVDYNNNPNICLQENQSFSDMVNNGGIKYYDDIKLKRVGRLRGKNGGNFYLTSQFFSYYYKNQLSNTIVWISSCSGYSNDTLVSAFANECNAKAVIGATDTVADGYSMDMVDVFVHKLLFGFTVDEALKEAKSLHGNNDDEWVINLGEKSNNTPAEFKIYNGGNETLVELFPVEVEEYGTLSGTVIDESGNPVKNAGVFAIPNRGNTYKAITDDNGRFIINDCPVDSYQIEVSAEGYELYQSDEFLSTDYVVLEGQEQKSVTIQLKKSTSSKIELKDYLGTSLSIFIENEKGMYDVGATSGIEYKNDYLIVSAPMLNKDTIEFFEITNNCNYSIHGVYYGMTMEDANNLLLQNSIELSDDLPNYKYFHMNDGTQVSIHADNEKIVKICIWSSKETNENITYNINGTELSRYTFSIDGTDFTAILFEEKWDGISADLNYLLTVFKGSSETNLSYIIVNYKHNTGTDSSSTNILDYMEVHNNNLGITEHKTSDMMIVSNYLWDSATNQFTYNGGNQIGGY